jgi:hypothetical protein
LVASYKVVVDCGVPTTASHKVAHGLSRTAISELRYGTGKGAFLSGFVSSGFSVGKGAGPGGAFAMAIVGGTASAIGGGKFANGAMGSAFQYLFNDWLSDMRQKVNENVMRNEEARKQTMKNLIIASKNAGDNLDNISTGLGFLAATSSVYPIPQVQAYSKLLEIGSILADGGKQFFYYLGNDLDGGSVLIDVVGASIPVPNKVLDFAIDESVDKGYGAIK